MYGVLRQREACAPLLRRRAALPLPLQHQVQRSGAHYVVARAGNAGGADGAGAPPPEQQPPLSGPGGGAAAGDPAAALAACLGHVARGDLDALLEYVPDEVIDKVIEMRRCASGGGAPSWLRFADVLQADAPSLLYLDSFATRHLAHAPPRALRLLSAVRVSPERYLQRCAVTAESGEEAVLAFEMALVRLEWVGGRVGGHGCAGDLQGSRRWGQAIPCHHQHQHLCVFSFSSPIPTPHPAARVPRVAVPRPAARPQALDAALRARRARARERRR